MPAGADVTPDTSNDALARRYDEVAYGALPHRLTHPDRLAAVAAFLGLDPPDPATCRVLEVGCNDGGNLIPMALTLPEAQFVGCDLSPRAIASARATADALGLRNVRFVDRDVATLDEDGERFDYVVAHGFYSWVPREARDALFALARRRLAPNGLAYVSFNALPGCRVRQAAWDVLHHHVDHIDDPRERIEAARRFAKLLADGGAALHEADHALRAEFRAIAERSDSAIFHDDLAVPNEPVYFHAFAEHAANYGLAYLAEAELATMSAAGVSNEARQLLSTLPPLEREQYLDFVRLRRFRQSLLRHAETELRRTADSSWLDGTQLLADTALLQAAQGGTLDTIARGLATANGPHGAVRSILDALLQQWPGSLPYEDVAARYGANGTRPLAAVLTDAFVGNIVDLRHRSPPYAISIAERPTASPLARWQVVGHPEVTTLMHGRVALSDPNARRLLALLDGTRDREALSQAMRGGHQLPDARIAAAFVDHALAQFAKLALLMPALTRPPHG